MSSDVAHRGLRYLIRSSGTPEVSTNNLLHELLSADAGMRVAFLESLTTLLSRDLTGCAVHRESPVLDPLTGRTSFHDFRLSATGSAPDCIIETKVDSSLTSADQATRYFGQLSAGGTLVIVTRAPLLPALATQAGAQIGLPLTEINGVYQGRLGQRTVVVMSWTRLLRGIVGVDGRPYAELLALDAALEDISDFAPFTPAVEDIASGEMVRQVIRVAWALCERLPQRLKSAGVDVDSISSPKQRAGEVYVKITVLDHQFWVGYDAQYWATTPGDPSDSSSGTMTELSPSPFWAGRWHERPRKIQAATVSARRQRLDRLEVTRPLSVVLGVPEDRVIEVLLDQAVEHVGAIARGLRADPVAASSSGSEADEDSQDSTDDDRGDDDVAGA